MAGWAPAERSSRSADRLSYARASSPATWHKAVSAAPADVVWAAIFGLAAEVTLVQSSLTQNTARNGEARVTSVDLVQKPARGGGLFVLDPGAKAPINGPPHASRLVDSTISGNVGDTNDPTGSDVSLEHEALGGSAILGSVRQRGHKRPRPRASSQARWCRRRTP